MNKILLISDFDSRLSWGIGVSKLFKDLNYEVSVLLLRSTIPETLSESEICSSNVDCCNNISSIKVYETCSLVDIVILGVGGAAHVKFFFLFNRFFKGQNKPLIISGFNGLVDNTNPHGLLCRLGSDFIFINSKKDLENFREILGSLRIDVNSLLLSGYVRDYLFKIPDSNKSKNTVICFADQSLVFKNNKEREYVATKIIDISLKNPNKSIVVQLREKENTSSPKGRNKDISFFVKKIIKKEKLYINNIIFKSGKPFEAIKDSHHIIGFSSTLLIEGLIKGKNVSVITDLGISHQFGNHVFVGSGLLSSFDEIAGGELKQVNENWLQDNVFYDADYLAQLARKIDLISANKVHCGYARPQYYTIDNFPFFYRNVKEIITSKGVSKNELIQKVKKTYIKAAAVFRRCKKE